MERLSFSLKLQQDKFKDLWPKWIAFITQLDQA